MSTVDSITEEELIKAIEAALETAPDAEPGTITSTEYADHIGMSQKSALVRIKKAMAAGVLEPAKIKRTNLHGTRHTVNGYRLVKD